MFAHILATIAQLPTVIFTIPMGVVALYWVMVILGALHVNILGAGEGLDFDGGLEAHGLGGADGAGADGLGADGADAAGADGGGMDGDGDVSGGDHGGAADAFAALKLRSVPMTVAISLLTTFAWLTSIALSFSVATFAPHLDIWPVRAGIALTAPVVSLFLSSLAIRPLAPLFVVHNATGNHELIGKVVTIRTGSVDTRFGEATLQEGGGSDLVLRVRVDEDGGLARGDQALIVAWDEEREAFTVAPMDDVLRGSRKS
jgi:hypothetical protein